MTGFSGIMTTPMTPFDGKDGLCLDLIEPFIAHQVENGVTGFFCLGTWGGFALQSMDERRLVAEAYCAAAKKYNASVIVQVTCLSASDTLALARHAEELGVDAVASVVPMHYSADGYLGMDEYKRYFSALAENLEVPIHLYNNQRTTGVLLSPGQVVELASTSGVKGVKDGSKNAGWLLEIQDLLAKKNVALDILPGNSIAMIYAAPFGVRCVMSGAGVCFPKLSVDTFNALEAKDADLASRLFRLLMASSRIVAKHGKPAVVSYSLLRLLGRDLGVSRAPWRATDEEAAKKTLEELRQLDGMADYLG